MSGKGGSVSVPSLLWEAKSVTERYLTTTEAAEALDLAPSTLRRWAQNGDVNPAFTTVGGRYRWDLDSLRRQLDEKQQNP